MVTAHLLIFNCLNIPVVTAATAKPLVSVVQSEENSQYWEGISNRLQTMGVPYCVLPLSNVRSVADWGDRRIVFLPNIETLTPAQAIALQAWVNNGGNLIASGPVGSLSSPGVRELLKTILGSYWGFSLKDTQQLNPLKTQIPNWLNQTKLFGTAHGGVLVPDDTAGKVVAVWNSPDHPPAVVLTERSTLLGWRWGTDAASTTELDIAWLQTAVNRHLATSSNSKKNIPEVPPNCSPSPLRAATATSSPNPQSPIPNRQSPIPSRQSPLPSRQSPLANPQSPIPNRQSPIPNPQSPIKSPPKQDEAIDELENTIPWNIAPNSNAPINQSQAAAMQQQLENLIGRVESANLTALAHTSHRNQSQSVKEEHTELVASGTSATTPNQKQVLAQARVVAKNLPRLIANKNYALARQQWLAARTNLWKQFPINRRLATAEIRAVWLDRGTIIRAGSEQGLAKIFDRLAQAGINTVFFETVNAGYPIYPSRVAPQQNPLIRGWNPLAAGVKLAHARGMELHAWVWTFAAGNQRHNQLLKLNIDYPGPVLAAHPDWANYDHQGKIIPVGQTKPFFDPANPELRQYLLNLYEEIVTEYNVDGLQLDYIRYPFQDPKAGRIYGYGKAAREQFQKLTGVDPISITPSQTQLWQRWTAFRTQQVDSFVTQVSQMLRQKRNNLILSVAVFPLPEQERIQKLQQHWEVWARRGDVDVIIPMTYAQDTVRFQTLAQPWISSTQLGSTLLVPGIRLLSLPKLAAFDQLQLIRDLPVSGYALFAAENLNKELHQLFTNTQGQLQSEVSEPIPHRNSFYAALTRYVALQREWQMVLPKEKVQISPKIGLDLHNQAEVVKNSLSQLAGSPSRTKLLATKAALTRFKAQFRLLMRQQGRENTYQFKVWENRLAAIERLLRYGERRLKLDAKN